MNTAAMNLEINGMFEFEIISHMYFLHLSLLFQVSYFEIYMDKIRDLLDGKCESDSYNCDDEDDDN